MNRIHRICMTDTSRAGHKAINRTAYLFSGIAVVAALFAGCSLFDRDSSDVLMPPEVVDVSNVPNAVPVSLPLSKYGNPTSYVVAGKRYYTMPSSMGYKESGIASWYGTESQGKRTSSGETYDNYGMTAAHRTLPLPSFVQVTNKQNGRSVIVKINDRGPFHNNRLIELSYAAAVKLGIVGYGTGLVEVTSINPQDYKTEPEQILREASKELYLQAGAFQVRKNAEHLRADIVAKGLGPARIIEPTEINDLYVVQVGPFKDAAEAEKVASTLKPMGVNAITRYDEDSGSMALDEQPTMRTKTPAPRPAAPSRIESAVMEKTAAAEAETAARKPDVVAMDTGTAELPADAGTSKWKFWQWLPAMLKPAATVPADTAMGTTVAATAGTATNLVTVATTAGTATNLVTDTAEMVPETAEPEAMAMAADTAEPAAETAASKWKFWQKRPAMAEPEAEMPAETTATLATAAPESVAEEGEPDVVAMAADTAEPAAEAATSKWKFWQKRPAMVEPEAEMPAETTATLATAAPESVAETSEPDVVAMAADTAEPAADPGTSKWKFWQRAPAKLKPGAGAPAVTTMDKVTVASEPEVVAMATTTSAPVQQDMSPVYLQTGAFRLHENAERLRPNVEALAPGAFQIIETSGARTLYKIQIGPLQGTAEAMRVTRELKAVGINPKIVDSSTGSKMMASATRYTPKPIDQIGKPAKPVVKPAAPLMHAAVAKPVKSKSAAVVAAPYARHPAPATEQPVAQMRAAEPVARPKPAPAAPVLRGKKSLFQQAGAFAVPKNATRLRTRIVDKTQEPTEIVQEPTELARGLTNLHKVQVGPLENKTEAMRIKRALEPLGVTDSFPVYRQQ